jgi:hypothetical protein
MFIINFYLNMFWAPLCPSSGEQRTHYCVWCIVLVLLDVVGSGCGALSCRMWALCVVGRCLVGCEHCVLWGAVLQDVSTVCCGALSCRMWALWRFLFETFIMLTSHKTEPHNHYQPHPAEPEQYTKCSNGFFVLLKMGIIMPESCWDRS